jgi:hypothetical protein
VSLCLVRPITPNNTTHLVPETMTPLLQEFAEVFQPPEGLSPSRHIDHSIHLIPGSALPNAPTYRLAPTEIEEMERQLTDLINSGHIQPSSSPCASAAFVIPKRDTSKMRLVTNYRALNKATIKNRYPLPQIEELLDTLQGAKWFTKLDLTAAYHQVRMNPDDVWKTTFKTKFGLFEWKVIPFGLTNAPTTFMRLINDIFRAHLGRFEVIYLDDILIFNRAWDTHMQHVRHVLQILREHKLQVKAKKSYFGQTSVSYLGFLVSSEVIQPDPTRIQALKQWHLLSSARELKRFLGGINFYRKFIPSFSHLACPLHHLSNSSSTFIWTKEETSHFAQLKDALCSSPILHLLDLSQPFEIESDASQYAIGVILKQGGHPIAYHSENLSEANKNYSTYDKEFYSLVQALKQWRHYLLGKETILHTDHHPLIFINSQSKI